MRIVSKLHAFYSISHPREKESPFQVLNFKQMDYDESSEDRVFYPWTKSGCGKRLLCWISLSQGGLGGLPGFIWVGNSCWRWAIWVASYEHNANVIYLLLSNNKDYPVVAQWISTSDFHIGRKYSVLNVFSLYHINALVGKQTWFIMY